MRDHSRLIYVPRINRTDAKAFSLFVDHFCENAVILREEDKWKSSRKDKTEFVS